MIVDDTPENLQVLSHLLRKTGYTVSAFPRGAMALKAAAKKPPDLILLDINMPGMNGYEVCRKLKSTDALKDIPVLFISALDAAEDKVEAFRCGGLDYIPKPFQMEEVYARVNTHLKLHTAQKVLQRFNNQLQDQVAQQVEEINQSQLAMIFALAKLSHTRDDDTGMHLERVQHLCKVLSSSMAKNHEYAGIITETFITAIFHASPLHDLGKVGIEDAILLKPGRLTDAEFEIMKTHTTIGATTLESVHKQYPNNEFVEMGIDIAKYHHEKWDGTGYPTGLYGESIPLSARIMALVDVYEALRARRPYKEPFTHEKSRTIIIDGNGKNFDPKIVQEFIKIDRDFDVTYSVMADS